MSESTSSSDGGVGFFGALFLVFLTLKLVGVEPVASWSWWWVTAPLWAPWVLIISIFVLFVIAVCVLAAIAHVLDVQDKKKKAKNRKKNRDRYCS